MPPVARTWPWFHQAETKAGNLGATGATGFPSWDTNPPEQSAQQGAGGGYFTNGTFRQTEGSSDPTFGAQLVGEHSGPIDTLVVTLYLFAPGLQAQGTESILSSVDLVINGALVAIGDSLEFPLTEGGDAAAKTAFAITGLQRSFERNGISLDPEATHEIELYVTSYAIATTTAIYVYDTTEVPSGIVFNVPDVSEHLRIQAF